LSLHYRSTNHSFPALGPKSLLCSKSLYKAWGDNVRCPSYRTLLQHSFALLEAVEPICFSTPRIAHYRQWTRPDSCLTNSKHLPAVHLNSVAVSGDTGPQDGFLLPSDP